MNKEKCKMITKQFMGNLAKKVFESATHAAVFAFVSKKVGDLLEKQDKKKENTEQIRVENTKVEENV